MRVSGRASRQRRYRLPCEDCSLSRAGTIGSDESHIKALAQTARKTVIGGMKPEPKSAPQEVLAGLVERVTFHNEENGFCVLRTKARGHRDLVTVVGQAVRDVQVLCPMNRGGVGARSLNVELQAVLNPAGERKVERFGWTFAPGDKVMQIENDYDKEVYNGDIGYIGDVDPEAGEVTVSFDGRAVDLRIRRARRSGSGLCRDHPQEPGVRISRRDHPGSHAALPHAAAQPSLHRRDPRQAPRRTGRPEEGGRHRRPQRFEPAPLVEARRVALGKRTRSLNIRPDATTIVALGLAIERQC